MTHDECLPAVSLSLGLMGVIAIGIFVVLFVCLSRKIERDEIMKFATQMYGVGKRCPMLDRRTYIFNKPIAKSILSSSKSFGQSCCCFELKRARRCSLRPFSKVFVVVVAVGCV